MVLESILKTVEGIADSAVRVTNARARSITRVGRLGILIGGGLLALLLLAVVAAVSTTAALILVAAAFGAFILYRKV